MNNVNSLAPTNVGASSAGSKTPACENCSSNSSASKAPSFADMLKHADDSPALSNEQDTAAEQLPSEQGHLTAAMLTALAANDSHPSTSPLTLMGTASAEGLGAASSNATQILAGTNGAPQGSAIPKNEAFLELMNSPPNTATTGAADINGKVENGKPSIAENALTTNTQSAISQQMNQLQSTATPMEPNMHTAGGGASANQLKSDAENKALASATEKAGTSAIPDTKSDKSGDAPKVPTTSADFTEKTSAGQSAASSGDPAKAQTAKALFATDAAAKSATENSTLVSSTAPKTASSAANHLSTGDLSSSGRTQNNAPLQNTSPDGATSEPNNTQADTPSAAPKAKAMQQAASLFQALEGGGQNGVKNPDFTAPSLNTMQIGDLARPNGVPGALPVQNNPALPQVPMNNIAVHIAAQASAGHQRFEIRLDPPELGRIDIRLEVGRDGQTLTHMAVEKPETLDLLRQDQRALERALNNAGLDSRDGVSFSLREDNRNKQQGMNSQRDDQDQSDDNLTEQEETNEPTRTRTLNISSGLDISI